MDLGEILALETKLIGYQEAYYAGHPEVPDSEYDALIELLRKESPGSVVLSRIGREATTEKVKHLCPMGSQNKASDKDEFAEWYAKYQDNEMVAQHKLDGCSLELQYFDGVLIRAVTRGDGTYGDDVTVAAKKISGVVHHLNKSIGQLGGAVAVRGEVIMLRQMFKQFGGGKANPRNAAAGLLKRKSGIGAEHLSFISYDITTGYNIPTEVNKIETLRALGFTTVFCERLRTLEYVEVLRAALASGLRDELPYDIDGLVIKCNCVDRDDEALARPERQIAYKFDSEEAVTEVTDFEWSQNGARFTPVCIIDPVPLAGVTVSRATLHTVERYESLGLVVGDQILVSRRGDVIPHVEKLVAPSAKVPRVFAAPPKTCPACGNDLVRVGAFLECPNEKCLAVTQHRFAKWFATLGVKGLGPATLRTITKHCSDLSAIYELTVQDIIGFGFGATESTNIFNAIHSKQDVSLVKLIAGFDIDDVGEDTVQKLVTAGFRTIERFFAADDKDFVSVPGIGETTAMNLSYGLAMHMRELSELVYRGHVRVTAEVSEGALIGHVVVFTGALNTMSRDEAATLARSAGAVVKDSLVKATTLLVTNDTSSGSAKNKKAAELGVRIINEEEFVAMAKG